MDSRPKIVLKLVALAAVIYLLLVVLPSPRSSTIASFILLIVVVFLLGFLGGARSPVKVAPRDLLIYLVLSLLMVAGLIIYASYSARHHRSIDADFNSRWTMITLSAATAFGFTISNLWHCRRNKKFWAVIFGLLLVHFVVLVQIFPSGAHLPFVAALPISLVEYFVILVFLLFCGFPLKPPPRDRPVTPQARPVT
jgi:hypothetical protein